MIVEKAVGLAEAREIEPIVGHALGVGGRGEQAVDEAFVRVGRGVGDERIDLLERRRQARQRQRDAADQGFLVGGRGWLEALALETVEHEAIDVVGSVLREAVSGTAGRAGAMNAQCGRYSAPFSIHCSRMAICCAVSVLCVDSGGIRSSTFGRADAAHELAGFASPGTIACLPDVSGSSAIGELAEI